MHHLAGIQLRRDSDTLFRAVLAEREVCRVALAVGDGVWEIYTTVTAPGYEGRGIASLLVQFVLNAAEEAGVTVIPSCWYVDGLMHRHAPRYDHLRAGHRATDPGGACRIAPAVLGSDVADT
jgi:predicted GNAT family acetyltransferase